MASKRMGHRVESMEKTRRSASEIYGRQNKILHGIFVKAGFPYTQEKDYWCGVFAGIFGRTVKGLSDLALSERRKLIRHLSTNIKGYTVHNPGVPRDFRGWKKGDNDKCFEMIPSEDTQLRMAYGLLLELGQTPDKMGVIVRARYGVDHEQWLKPEQLRDLVNYLLYRVKKSRQ